MLSKILSSQTRDFQPGAVLPRKGFILAPSGGIFRVRLCDPMNRSTPGLPVNHQLPEFTQTHIHRVSDAIQPPHPLLSPSSSALHLSQHQGLFQCAWPLIIVFNTD